MNIDLVPMLSILFLHFVGDFFLQSNWMATNKSKNWNALSCHVAVNMMCMIPMGWKFAAVSGLLHFLLDAFTSRWAARLYAKGDIHNFFVVIGLDQMIHYTYLFVLYWFLNN